MSDKLMDTSPGGENTAYESIKTVTVPHDSQGGQISDTGNVQPPDTPSGPSAERAAKTAENVRYGQAMSEQGVGGMTEQQSGEANVDSGFGGAPAQAKHGTEGGGEGREAQGYGDGEDMDRTVGA